MKDAEEPAGKLARASSEMRETVSLGRACMRTVRYETPRKSTIASAPRIVSVAAAFRPFGGRKALTPFEIDSTPVSAEAPEANARTSTTMPAPAAAPAATGCGTAACGQLPATHLPTPVAIIANSAATKPYVGS